MITIVVLIKIENRKNPIVRFVISLTVVNVAAQKKSDTSSTGKTCDANKVLECAKPLTDPVARLTSKVTRDITNIINGGECFVKHWRI